MTRPPTPHGPVPSRDRLLDVLRRLVALLASLCALVRLLRRC